ncbi:uncharacterized protein LOC115052912 [Echeneis naucrates]|uniref:uncharacterized protein LOC115052912 n=1 Tax=Echeneis naucrates TaxID=173247 RepID=UPI00111372BC|nr:uncharacterized protein LOC115052912 [Echeneis naucrates]
MGETERADDEKRDIFCCPACGRKYDVALMLPCSHPMCGQCITAGEGTSSGQALLHGLSVCSVLCPCCRLPVELPCWTWSAAASCLPEHPTLSPPRMSSESGALPLDVQAKNKGRRRCRDATEERAQICSCDSTAAGSPTTPEDGVVDLREDEMAQSVFGLCFTLDPSSVPPSLHLSNTSLTVTYRGPSPDNEVRQTKMTSDPAALPQVCADVIIARGQYYWEVDVYNSSVYRIGVISLDGRGAWWLERQGASFCVVYDGSWEPLCTVPPQIKSLGVFLNMGGGTLSFHNPLTQEHLATLPTRFGTAGVLPALGLGQGQLRLRCRLPPPPHVFLSKDSAYRGPRGAAGGRWRREVPFQSVRKVIQKFEELAVSDSDSGLVSSFGSSCSTLLSLPDLGIPGTFPSGHAGQETKKDF